MAAPAMPPPITRVRLPPGLLEKKRVFVLTAAAKRLGVSHALPGCARRTEDRAHRSGCAVEESIAVEITASNPVCMDMRFEVTYIHSYVT